jgi:hypothetical protein
VLEWYLLMRTIDLLIGSGRGLNVYLNRRLGHCTLPNPRMTTIRVNLSRPPASSTSGRHHTSVRIILEETSIIHRTPHSNIRVEVV